MASKWIILQALLFEAAGLEILFGDSISNAQLLQYLAYHFMVSVLLSLVVVRLLPWRYRAPHTRSFMFLVTLQFAMPYIGSVGVFSGVLLALYLPQKTRLLPWNEIDVPELPFKPLEISAQLLYSQGGLRQVLREASSDDKRLHAVMATKQMRKRDAISILQTALTDRVDDVRLLAYSMLDSFEKDVSEDILRYQQELKNNTDSTRTGPLHKLLAQAYWEMTYLGLARGGVQRHFLNSALMEIDKQLAIEQDLDGIKLRGRILLALEDYSAAAESFRSALAAGIPSSQVVPYLAACHYHMRDFQGLRQLLAGYDYSRPGGNAFGQIVKFWGVDGATKKRRSARVL